MLRLQNPRSEIRFQTILFLFFSRRYVEAIDIFSLTQYA